MAAKARITPIEDIVKSVFSKIEMAAVCSKDEVERAWRNVIGEKGSGHSRPANFKKGALTVRVDSSVWLQELSQRKRHLLKALKRELGKDKISEIHFKIGDE